MPGVFEDEVFEEDVFEGEGGGGGAMPSLSEISALYVGSDPVLRAYFGSTLIWGDPPEPPEPPTDAPAHLPFYAETDAEPVGTFMPFFAEQTP